MLAQRMELEARFARYHEPQDPRLKAGVLVVEKEGLGVVDRVCGRPVVAMILWRFLNRADPVDSELAVDWARRQRINRVDCMVGVLDDEAEHVGVFPHDSAHLRPYDDATDSDEALDREGD